MSRVVVVGAGVVGLCTAWSLQRRGHEVVVLDSRTAPEAASWGNAGWVVPSLAAPVPGPGVPWFGVRSLATPGAPFRMRPSVRLAPWLLAFTRNCSRPAHERGTLATLELGRNAHARFDELLASGVQFCLQDKGVRYVGRTQAAVQAELEMLAPAAAYGYVIPAEPDDATTTRELEPALSRAVAASAYVKGDRHLDPGELVEGLESWLAERGVAVHRDQQVTGFVSRGDAVTSVRTSAGSQQADAVVIAAGARSAALCRQLGYRLPLQAGKGYSFLADLPVRPRTPLYLLEAKVAVTELARGVRFAGVMELSGVDPRLRPHRVQAMAAHASPYLHDWPDAVPQEQWAGLRPMTPDGLPVIGRVPFTDNVLVATGHAMLGVTLGPVTGEAVADLLDGRSDPRLVPFSPDRFRSSKGSVSAQLRAHSVRR